MHQQLARKKDRSHEQRSPFGAEHLACKPHVVVGTWIFLEKIRAQRICKKTEEVVKETQHKARVVDWVGMVDQYKVQSAENFLSMTHPGKNCLESNARSLRRCREAGQELCGPWIPIVLLTTWPFPWPSPFCKFYGYLSACENLFQN